VSSTAAQKRARAGRRVWGWDVEASDPERPWDGATLVVVKSEEGDCERFIGPDCLERFATHAQKARGIYLAHYGGGYDVPLLLNYWRPKKIVLSGSNILIAEDKKDLVLRDTFPWWLCGLAKMGDAVGLPKLDVDRAAMERLTLDEQVVYCERDVDIMLRGYEEARDFLRDRGAAHAWTAGQSAASLVRAIEPGTWRELKRHRNHVDDVKEMLDSGAVRGSRVECCVRGRVDGVHVYDIKSSYPARYAHDDVGVGMRRSLPHDTVGVWRCSWRWTDRRRIPPALDQTSMCGVGECSSWLIDDEIAAFEACGVKVTRHEGWSPLVSMPVAQDFAELMFSFKEGTSSARAFSKVFLNAWHGKATMNPLQQQFTEWHPKRGVEGPTLRGEWWSPAGAPRRVPEGEHGGWWHRYFTLDADGEGMCKPFQQPIMGALILGRARVALWQINDALFNAGWPVLYNDTDSVMTTCPPDRMPVRLGKALGELAHEGGPYTGFFLGPKAYCLTDPSTGQVQKCALKGVPHKSYADGMFEANIFREARGDERIRGTGIFARKGKGHDVRAELFARALGPVGASKALKDGLSTFLRGARGVDEKGEKGRPGVWKRALVVRTVRPSGRGKIFFPDDPLRFQYMAPVEVAAARLLQQLPDTVTHATKRISHAAVHLVHDKGLAETVHDANVLPRLPREHVDAESGKRVSRYDRWAAFHELLDAAGVTADDPGQYPFGELDRMWRKWSRGGGPEPGAWTGGELDALRRECGVLFLSSPFEAWERLTRRAVVWRDVLPAVAALRGVEGLERLHVPLELLQPSKELLVRTAAGQAWLAALGPLWDPEDESDSSALELENPDYPEPA
jgi:hypothetical protein